MQVFHIVDIIIRRGCALKCSLFLLWLSLLSVVAVAQEDPVLMRIGDTKVLRSEFESWYRRHTTEKETSESTVWKFVDVKLKARAAEAVGLDTLLRFTESVDDYRCLLSRCSLLGEAESGETREEKQVLIYHIHRPLPQNATSAMLHRAETAMDSLYQCVVAVKHSRDSLSALPHGVQKWVIPFEMPVELEDSAYSLRVGQTSKPFYTPQGLNIIKVLEHRFVSNNVKFDETIEERVTDRVEILKKRYNYKANEAGQKELLIKGETSRMLFALDGKEFTGVDFARFAAAYQAGTKRQLKAFIVKSVFDYADSCLWQQPSETACCLILFRDSLLAQIARDYFVPMRGQVDETALETYFVAHRSDYCWTSPRYCGIVLQCSSKQVAKKVRKLLRSLPEEEWSKTVQLVFNKDGMMQVLYEQGRFAPGENPWVDERIFKQGKAAVDEKYPHVVLLGKKKKKPENHREVEAELVNDYLLHQETEWMASLRASTKVEIDQEVLKTVNKH